VSIAVEAVQDQVRALPIQFEPREPYPQQPPLPDDRS
jgi:hypothetical protein